MVLGLQTVVEVMVVFDWVAKVKDRESIGAVEGVLAAVVAVVLA